jgi:hypothetical protein
MTIRRKHLGRLTLIEMKEFVTANRQVACSAVEQESAYGLIERVVKVCCNIVMKQGTS